MNKEASKYNKWVVMLSILIPLVVAALFGIKIPNVEPLTFLPPIYASTNTITAFVLIAAFWAVRNKKFVLHERLIKFAIVLSVLFLTMYMAYHMTSDSTVFGDVNKNGVLDVNEKEDIGLYRYIYLTVLLTHIVLSVMVIPFVLITYIRAITKDFERHKKIARITFPLWLYVAVSGVVVYIMISPYY